MEELLEPFLCPVLQEKMREPMLCRHCGHSFEHAAVEEVLTRAGRCPLCRTAWQRADLVPNRTLQEVLFQLPLLLAARSPSSRKGAASRIVSLREGQTYIAGRHWDQGDGLKVVMGELLVVKELPDGSDVALVHPLGDPKKTGRVPASILEEQRRPPLSYAEGDLCQVVRTFWFEGSGDYLNVQRFEVVRVLRAVKPPGTWVYVESLEVPGSQGWVPEAFLCKGDRPTLALPAAAEPVRPTFAGPGEARTLLAALAAQQTDAPTGHRPVITWLLQDIQRRQGTGQPGTEVGSPEGARPRATRPQRAAQRPRPIWAVAQQDWLQELQAQAQALQAQAEEMQAAALQAAMAVTARFPQATRPVGEGHATQPAQAVAAQRPQAQASWAARDVAAQGQAPQQAPAVAAQTRQAARAANDVAALGGRAQAVAAPTPQAVRATNDVAAQQAQAAQAVRATNDVAAQQAQAAQAVRATNDVAVQGGRAQAVAAPTPQAVRATNDVAAQQAQAAQAVRATNDVAVQGGREGARAPQAVAQAARVTEEVARPTEEGGAQFHLRRILFAEGEARNTSRHVEEGVPRTTGGAAAQPREWLLPGRGAQLLAEGEASMLRAGNASTQGRMAHLGLQMGEAEDVPREGWEYIDPQQQVRGPFTLREMQAWHSSGWLQPDLLIRCHPDDRFVRLQELYPQPLIPFRSSPRRPS